MGVLERLMAQGLARDVDRHFARLMGALADRDSEALRLGACLVSARTGEGDVCIDLARYAGQLLAGGSRPVTAPELAAWREALRSSGVVGRPGEAAPLILDPADRLYLGRYWYFESRLAAALRCRAAFLAEAIAPQGVRAALERLFPEMGDSLEGQALAAALVLLRRLIVVSGGPGTGKTRAVTRTLALLAQCAPAESLRIALVAPTGKAAARLAESVRAEKQAMASSPAVLAAIPEQGTTIHRLLGFSRAHGGFRHDAEHPLAVDVLVVDEASMVDLPLMTRLVDALRTTARLILLGDKDQLASVEAGAVLADLCGERAGRGYSHSLCEELDKMCGVRPAAPARAEKHPLADCIVLLERSYRFGEESGIGMLAKAVNAGDAQSALRLLDGDVPADVRWTSRTGDTAVRLGQTAVARFEAALQARTPGDALGAYGQFRILAALREGPFGVTHLNAVVETALRRAHLVSGSAPWYPGRPIMITRNDHRLGLFNGDVGVALAQPAPGGALQVFFESPDGGFRAVAPARLPPHETAYAMTVHKSQGSEFDEVLLVLPDRPAPILSRELVYTGITRARMGVEIWSPGHVLVEAITHPVQRSSGLRDAIWGSAGSTPPGPTCPV